MIIMGTMNLSLPDELLEELKSTVPVRQRSGFIAEAIRMRLALLEQVIAVRETAGTWSDEGRSNPSAVIRKERENWARNDHSKEDA